MGNGQFAFTADATGLQTFPEAFTNTTRSARCREWGWHTAPNPEGWSIEKFAFKEFDVFGRKVGYADVPGNRQTPEIKWLRANPHRLHLGRIGFVLTEPDGSAAGTNDLQDVDQTLDLWNGVLRSRFTFEGQPVDVETVCHPQLDLLAVRVLLAAVERRPRPDRAAVSRTAPARPSRRTGPNPRRTKRDAPGTRGRRGFRTEAGQ